MPFGQTMLAQSPSRAKPLRLPGSSSSSSSSSGGCGKDDYSFAAAGSSPPSIAEAFSPAHYVPVISSCDSPTPPIPEDAPLTRDATDSPPLSATTMGRVRSGSVGSPARRQLLDQIDGVVVTPSAAAVAAAATATASAGGPSSCSGDAVVPGSPARNSPCCFASSPLAHSPLAKATDPEHVAASCETCAVMDTEEQHIMRARGGSINQQFLRVASGPTDAEQPKKGTIGRAQGRVQGRSRAYTFAGSKTEPPAGGAI